jgi:hypothetical protein
MSELTCPHCTKRFDTEDRCPAALGMGTCVESSGHDGWHWTVLGSGGITRWTGFHTVHSSCPGRTNLRHWCDKPYGHGGLHKGWNTYSFGDPEPSAPTPPNKGDTPE